MRSVPGLTSDVVVGRDVPRYSLAVKMSITLRKLPNSEMGKLARPDIVRNKYGDEYQNPLRLLR